MRQYFANITPVFPDPVLYTPDFAYMDKMLQRKEAQYNKGFSQLSSVWKQMSRPVTNSENARVRDAFLKQAKENLKDLSSLDLSDYKNIENAMQVFAPYSNNSELIADQELTEFWNNQESVAEGYRNTDGGKYFSEDNLNDIKLQRNAFAQSKPTDWKSFYSNKRSYTPFYDANAEIATVMKNFKPSSVTTIKKNGAYITTITDKSWYKEEVQKYLEANLSPKAKEQWAINSRVRLMNNPEGVRDAYIQQTKSRIPAIDKELKETELKLLKTKKPEEIEVLLQNKEYYEKLKEELNENITNLETGDPKYLTQKLEPLAKSVYINGMIDNVSEGFSHKDIDQKLDFDDWVLTQYRESQANWRTKYTQDQATYRTKLTLSAKEGDGGSDAIPVNVPTTEQETDEDVQEIKRQLPTYEQKMNTAETNLKAKVVNSDPNDNIRSINTVTEEDLRRYMAKNPNDEAVMNYATSRAAYDDAVQYLNGGNNFDDAKRYAESNMGDRYQRMKDYELAIAQTGYYDNTRTSTQGVLRGDMPSGVRPQDMAQVRAFVSDRASQKTGISPQEYASYKNEYDQYVKGYVERANNQIRTNASGMAFSNVSENYKVKTGQVAGLLNTNTKDIEAFTVVPKSNKTFGLNIKMATPPGKSLTKDQYQAYADQIVTRYSGAKVSPYNEKNPNTISVRGLSSNVLTSFRNEDVYSNVHEAHTPSVLNLSTWRGDGTPGFSKTVVLPFQDNTKGSWAMPIRKVIGADPSSDFYEVLNPLNGKPIPIYNTQGNIVVPYKTIAQLMYERSTNELNSIFNNIK